jgi:hypothetical protein
LEAPESGFRSARALIGWIDEAAAAALLGPWGNSLATPANLSRVHSAHAAVAQRPQSPNPSANQVVIDLPPELASHADRLRKRPAAAPYFGEGWSIGLVDLRYVHALLPTVVTDGGSERIRSASRHEIGSVAAITLPAETETLTLAPGFNQLNNTWTISSDNPNLRVVGQTAGPVPGPVEGTAPGLLMMGFVVAQLPSFMQVMLYENRWYLRDGYHRGTSLLRAGHRLVPAFTRRVDRPDELLIPGGLPLGVVLSPGPPRLADYFDDAVSTEISVPITRKVVVVQALDLTVLDVNLPKSAGPPTD